MFVNFLGCTVLFAAVLYLSLFLDYVGLVLVGGGAVLALLWMILLKLDRTEKKLDKLLKMRDEHDK